MTKAKIAISIDEQLLATVKSRVAKGEASSVSGFIEQKLIEQLDDDEAWELENRQIWEESGGPPTPEEDAWVEARLRGEDPGPPPTERMKPTVGQQ